MEKTIHIVAFGGSLRKDSMNKKFAKTALNIANNLNVKTTYLDLNNYEIPLYNGDEEAKNFPESIKEIKKILRTADALIISTPEYEANIPGVLKNVLDWISRKENAQDMKIELIDKPVLVLGASAGYFGAIRGITQLRHLLLHMKMIVLPEMMALPDAGNAFDEQGNLKDEKKRQTLETNVKKLINIANKLK